MSNNSFCNEKIIELQKHLKKIQLGRIEIQSKFNFVVPDYILDEIIERNDCCRKENINALIGLAIVNGRISKEQGQVIRNEILMDIG